MNQAQGMAIRAQAVGVTLIPAIQTLAHLTNPLKWQFAGNIRDTEDILLVGEEETYTFLEAAIRSIRSCFATDQLHIGMDEAHQLGKGKYLEIHGLHSLIRGMIMVIIIPVNHFDSRKVRK